MKKTLLVATALVCLGVVAVATSPVSAESDITVTVDGEGVPDGETVEVGSSPFVNVTVESDATLTSVRTGTRSSYSIDGAEGSTYRTARNVSVLSEKEFVVEATEEGGETYTHTVVLARPSETPRDLQRDVRSIRDNIESVEDDVERLEDRREQLRQRNEDLNRQLNETRESVDGSDGGGGDTGDEDGGGQGMPGFTALVALIALSVASVAVRYRGGT